MKTLFTLIVIYSLFTLDLIGQEKESYRFSVEAQFEYGFLIGHHPEMQRLSTRYFPSFKVYAGHRTTGKKAWHQQYKFPELGVGVYYSPLMFNDELGQAFAFFGYFDQVLGKKDRNNFKFRFGFGPGFLSSKFNSIDNNQNIAIGTNLNIFVFLEFQKAFKLSNALDLKIGVGAAHFSNTGVHMPNLGINLATAQIGLKYRIGLQQLSTEAIPLPKNKVWTHEVLLSFGRKQSETEKAQSTIVNTRYQGIFSLTYKSSLIGTADLFFDIGDAYKYESQKVENYFQAGLAAGYLLNIEQFQAMLQWGVYLYNPNSDFMAFYHRIGFKWIATEHLLVNLSLRTEWARARNLELGLGWRF